MSRVFTEQETEYWLELETRQLPAPDGLKHSFTDTRVFWNHFDFLLSRQVLTAGRIVELALQERDRRGLPLEITLSHVVSLHYSAEMENVDARIKEIDEALLKAKTALERNFKRATVPC